MTNTTQPNNNKAINTLHSQSNILQIAFTIYLRIAIIIRTISPMEMEVFDGVPKTTSRVLVLCMVPLVVLWVVLWVNVRCRECTGRTGSDRAAELEHFEVINLEIGTVEILSRRFCYISRTRRSFVFTSTVSAVPLAIWPSSTECNVDDNAVILEIRGLTATAKREEGSGCSEGSELLIGDGAHFGIHPRVLFCVISWNIPHFDSCFLVP